jgi:hypothetical protein
LQQRKGFCEMTITTNQHSRIGWICYWIKFLFK